MAEPRDFAEFYASTFHSLTIQLLAHTGSMADAHDVVQEAFCRALTRWSAVSTYDDPVAWVRRVAWNLATSRWRRLRVLLDITRKHREEHVAGPNPDRLAIVTALRALPSRQRQALALHYLADASVAEIAEITGASEGTVKSWLHRGRRSLAELLSEEDNTITGGARDARA